MLVVPVVAGAPTVYSATLASSVWSVKPDPAQTEEPKSEEGRLTPLNIGLIVGGVLLLVVFIALFVRKSGRVVAVEGQQGGIE